uniref:Ovule protein n=1 Tax=Steinernema glaseri TaxID=37863 RepID=A0A1I7ZBB3_9BILA
MEHWSLEGCATSPKPAHSLLVIDQDSESKEVYMKIRDQWERSTYLWFCKSRAHNSESTSYLFIFKCLSRIARNSLGPNEYRSLRNKRAECSGSNMIRLRW